MSHHVPGGLTARGLLHPWQLPDQALAELQKGVPSSHCQIWDRVEAVPTACACGPPSQPSPQRDTIFQSQWKITGMFNIVALAA